MQIRNWTGLTENIANEEQETVQDGIGELRLEKSFPSSRIQPDSKSFNLFKAHMWLLSLPKPKLAHFPQIKITRKINDKSNSFLFSTRSSDLQTSTSSKQIADLCSENDCNCCLPSVNERHNLPTRAYSRTRHRPNLTVISLALSWTVMILSKPLTRIWGETNQAFHQDFVNWEGSDRPLSTRTHPRTAWVIPNANASSPTMRHLAAWRVTVERIRKRFPSKLAARGNQLKCRMIGAIFPRDLTWMDLLLGEVLVVSESMRSGRMNEEWWM
jgi:hypothetical protein